MESAQLFHKVLRKAGIFLQLCQLFPMLKYGHNAKIDHVHYGWISGYQTQECHLHSLISAQATWLDLLDHQLRNEIVFRFLGLLIYQIAQVGEEPFTGF